MKARRRLDGAEQEALKRAVAKSFEAEEMQRDADHDEQVQRLLGSLDSFSKDAGK